MSEGKVLTKTLTFGLGVAMGYDLKSETPVPLEDEKRHELYQYLFRASKAIGQACNIQSAQMYAERVMGVPKEEHKKYAPSNPAIRDRLQDCAMLSGGVLSQVYVSVKPHFTGDHGKELLYSGKRQLPTHRTDGTHPIPVRGDGTKIVAVGADAFLVVQMFEAKWSSEHGLPNWLAFRIRAKERDRVLRDQIEKVLKGD